MSDIKRINVNSNKATINPDYDAKLNHTDASLFTADALKYIAGYNPANGINMQNAVDVLAKKHSNLESKAAYITESESDSDLDIGDSEGNVLARFSDGHFQTLNFDSRKTTDSSFIKYNPELNGTDSSLFSVEELQKINGYDSKYGITVQNTIDILTNKHIELEEESKKHPYIDDKLYDSDFGISDEDGNVIAKINNGNFQTKNFDSTLTTLVYRDNSESDLDIGDISGNVICQFKDGHIKTKMFDSRSIVNNQTSVNKDVISSITYTKQNPFNIESNIIFKDAYKRTLPDNVVPLIIIAGQSNADGRAAAATASNWDSTSWLAEASYSVNNFMMWNSTTKEFSTYNVLTNNGAGLDEDSDGSGKNKYSFDPFFAKEFIDYYNRPLYAIRLSLGGIGIYDTTSRAGHRQTWNAKIGYFEKQGQTNVNYQCLNLLTKVKEAQSWADNNNVILIPIAILWHLGEHDANVNGLPLYELNLSNVISFIRGIFGAPALPFINGFINENYSQYFVQLNQIYLDMNAIDPYMKSVDMEGHYTSIGDNLHFDGQALLYMGVLMFEKYKELNVLI